MLAAAAPPPAATPATLAALQVQQLALLFRRQVLDVGPPVDGFAIDFAAARAQHEEVVRGSESFVLQQPRGARAVALAEAPLHVQ